MNIEVKTDLWTYLKSTERPIVMYGMGNGADKILAVCERYGIEISDFFASDGFVRGHSFHSKTVLSYSQIKEKYKDPIVLLSFASSLPDVIETIKKVDAETELYAPDVPVFGDTLFNMEFFEENRKNFEMAYSMFCDERSREVFESIINFKLSGKIKYLFDADCDKDEVVSSILHTENYRVTADLGAYNGDTVRELLTYTLPQKIYALEPDRRNFRKLSEYSANETRCEVVPINAAAWSEKTVLTFDGSGNRNSNISSSAAKTVDVDALKLDDVIAEQCCDYIKYDVEGSEHQAIVGSQNTISAYRPEMLVSAYHRSQDLFELPFLIRSICPDYRLYLRKFPYIPAWDLNIYAI